MSQPPLKQNQTPSESISSIETIPFSLLVPIQSHLLRILFFRKYTLCSSTFNYQFYETVFTFFSKSGYVSQCFFKSATIAVRVFLERHTLPGEPEDFSLLSKVAQYFGAELSSVYLSDDCNPQDLIPYKSLVTSLRFSRTIDTDFLLSSSTLFFPRLKQLMLEVADEDLLTLVCTKLQSNTTVVELSLFLYEECPSLSTNLKKLISAKTAIEKISIPIYDGSHTSVDHQTFEKLCSCIANNSHLREIDFSGIVVDVLSAIKHLFNSRSIQKLHLPRYDDDHCHVSFEKNISSSLRELFIYGVDLKCLNVFEFTEHLQLTQFSYCCNFSKIFNF
ncbi:hypothetical protein GEMRC1_008969 [Eukaryota sp. GEM-RC1]